MGKKVGGTFFTRVKDSRGTPLNGTKSRSDISERIKHFQNGGKVGPPQKVGGLARYSKIILNGFDRPTKDGIGRLAYFRIVGRNIYRPPIPEYSRTHPNQPQPQYTIAREPNGHRTLGLQRNPP